MHLFSFCFGNNGFTSGLVVSAWFPVKQVRPGKDGLPFEMVKFRTMTNKKNSKGELLSDKERMTTFGALLRSSSLDELPELFNVLKGDMSLVGPRPLLMEYLPLYNEKQKRRQDVKPGITGWAQINGRNWDERFELDFGMWKTRLVFWTPRYIADFLKRVMIKVNF